MDLVFPHGPFNFNWPGIRREEGCEREVGCLSEANEACKQTRVRLDESLAFDAEERREERGEDKEESDTLLERKKKTQDGRVLGM